ncbi:hypothetical protein V6N12_037369 [Hibiscus sabdariffa]|uniref:Uncharacterized protein n=1 Tax=Hibiscus sabdariffa TaxID=183260 RepID=A0ABR2BZ23_9ROSI
MSQESVGNTVVASNNVNMNANNLNLQDVIHEMDRRHNSEFEEEYDGEIDDEQAYERATRQGLRRQEPRHQRAHP